MVQLALIDIVQSVDEEYGCTNNLTKPAKSIQHSL